MPPPSLCAQDNEVVYKCRGGEALHCLQTSVPEGCGRTPLCRECVMRNSVTKCFQGQAVSRARMTMEFLPGNGRKTRELLITTTPMTAGGERLALLVVEDITINDELEQALRRSEKLAVTGRLLTTIAHEINNPLESLKQPALSHKVGAEA